MSTTIFDCNDVDAHYESVVLSQCTPGEECLSFQMAYRRPHFLIRVMPFIPDLLTRGRKYLMAVTNRRLLIIELTNPFSKVHLKQFKTLTASLPLDELCGIAFHEGLFTSTVTIHATRRRRFRLKTSPRAAKPFATDVQRVAQCEMLGRQKPPVESPAPKRIPVTV